MKRARSSVLVLAALAACAGNPYQGAGDPGQVAAALARARPVAGKPANFLGRPLAFLVLGGARGPRVGAYDIGGARLVWTQPAAVTGRIQVGTNVIVHGERGSVVARDIEKGKVQWTHAPGEGERILGYAIDGASAFVVVQGGGKAVLRALDARTGAERWMHTLPSASAGSPAAGGGLVAVPLQSQYVLLFDGATGAALAQVLSNEEAATFVRVLPEGIFFGSQGVFTLSPETAGGSRRAAGYARANLPSFVRPAYGFDLYRPEEADYSAFDRKRILWRMAARAPGEGRAQFRDGLALVHDYRFFFAFDATSGALRWAYSHPRTEAVASEHVGGAVVFVTADGDLGALEAATGRRFFEGRLQDEVVRGATFDAEGFGPTVMGTLTGSPNPPAMGSGERSSPAPDAIGVAVPPAPALAETLTAIVWDIDRRFAERKLFAVTELGRQPGRAVTAELIAILQENGFDPEVQRRAGEALVARQDAAAGDLLAQALEAHLDYTQPQARRPALDVLARAARALGAKAAPASPALARHLLRPETDPAAAAEVARALGAIGAREAAVPALRDFLTLYRADPVADADPAAVIAASDALLALGGAPERQLLLYLSLEPRTVDPLREHIESALP